ncbi:uncharacterized protein LOC120359448 [Solenopsis invicta]|uniref:uncharacterized protein LOC120359448 n=1 Tax=Solenopsis invicta TaxID=13686 RepID=UPI00193DE429|nr:uncharacterized protein LOC120359448 [Solenopsis invicta]
MIIKIVWKKKKKNVQVSLELDDKLMSESNNLSAWNDQTITELHSIQERVGKFLEDLYHDMTYQQVQHQQEKNINIQNILLQLCHMNEFFRDSEKREITSKRGKYIHMFSDTYLVNNSSKVKCPNVN